MEKPNLEYDLVVVGGGAAGQMAAISAKRSHLEFKIAIIDRTFALGRKILVCGAGRCNITNINLDKSISEHYYGDQEFIESVFSQFSYKNIVSFFNDLGIELYVERKTSIGKLFPITDQAKTVTALLEDELSRLGIEIFLNTEVTNVSKDSKFRIETKSEDSNLQNFLSRYLILSTGGKTYPALGSNGSGYLIAQNFRHSLILPVPSALPLVGKNPLSQELQGTKMEIEISSYIDNSLIKKRTDDVMFTQYGLSGPAVLNISREISIHLNREKKSNVYVSLNFLPGKEAHNLLEERWRKRPNQTIEKSLFGLFPNKIATALVKVTNIDKDKKVQDLNSDEIEKLIQTLTSYKIQITETKGWNEAEFTAGGIDTNEVKTFSIESKKVDGLYFCGEILDVDGDVGGFNLSWAWSSGFVAGQLK